MGTVLTSLCSASILHPFLQGVQASLQGCEPSLQGLEGAGHRIRQAGVVQIDAVHPPAVLDHHPAGHPHHRRVGGHLLEDHRSRPDLGPVPHLEGAQHLGPCGNDHIVADGRVPLPFLLARPAQDNALVEGDILPDLSGLADDHAHAVIDEEAGAQLRPRVDLNARQEPADVGDDPGQNVAPAAVEPVGDSVDLDGVEARIGQDDLPDALDGRVPLEDHLDVPLDPFKHALPPHNPCTWPQEKSPPRSLPAETGLPAVPLCLARPQNGPPRCGRPASSAVTGGTGTPYWPRWAFGRAAPGGTGTRWARALAAGTPLSGGRTLGPSPFIAFDASSPRGRLPAGLEVDPSEVDPL